MKTTKRLLSTLIAASGIIIAGCKATGHIDPKATGTISVGMTKAEVIRTLGQPETVSADGQAEVLSYTVERPWWNWKPLRVKIVQGKVESYQVVE